MAWGGPRDTHRGFLVTVVLSIGVVTLFDYVSEIAPRALQKARENMEANGSPAHSWRRVDHLRCHSLSRDLYELQNRPKLALSIQERISTVTSTAIAATAL